MSDTQDKGRIICLSNVYDQHYRDARGEPLPPNLCETKRRDVFRCLELATGRKVIVLSSPPKSPQKRGTKWLAPLKTEFSTHAQLFCGNLDGPKIRIPLSWFFYAMHVAGHVRDGDIVLIDNYEFIYVVAAYWTRLFRKVSFILDYEDGKHLIDHSWSGVLSGLAEKLGRGLIRAALLAQPALANRLLSGVPSIPVPGFVQAPTGGARNTAGEGMVNFIYSGSLDHTRGVDLLLAAVPLLPEDGWHLHITGSGALKESVAEFAGRESVRKKVTYHGGLPLAAYLELLAQCQMGLNCQRVSDAISSVTFPSKVFSYISAGLLVVSSRASDVPVICGDSCIYFDEETPESLAAAMRHGIANYSREKSRPRTLDVAQIYSIDGTAKRMENLLKSAGLI